MEKVELVQVKGLLNSGESQQESQARISATKALVKVGMKAYVENQLHELLVRVTVVAVTEDGFTVEHGGRRTLSRWADASFVKEGRKMPVLFDSSHSYTHVV